MFASKKPLDYGHTATLPIAVTPRTLQMVKTVKRFELLNVRCWWKKLPEPKHGWRGQRPQVLRDSHIILYPMKLPFSPVIPWKIPNVFGGSVGENGVQAPARTAAPCTNTSAWRSCWNWRIHR
jgi:hypothetical protein